MTIIGNDMEFWAGFFLVLAVFAAAAVAAYFILRRAFERIADRVADRLGDVVANMVGRGATTPFGRRTEAAARAAAGRVTRLDAYAAAEGISSEQARREFKDSIERLARLMDSAVTLPVVGPVGFDALLGLFPVVGDVTAAAISISLIARSLKYGVPHEVISRMLTNVLIDVLLGAVPVVGDAADMWFRANARNVALLRRYLEEDARNTIDVTPVSADDRR